MATGDGVLNPYAPLDSGSANHSHASASDSWLNPFAELELTVDRSWLYRRFVLRGQIEADIVWDARSATEFIEVNGRRVASQTAFLYVPRFDFVLGTGPQQLLAAIEVQLSWFAFVSSLKLEIDGETVYREGQALLR